MEVGRYALIVCNACPWAHRCLSMRKLKGLEHVIKEVAVVSFFLDMSIGWTFSDIAGEASKDILTEAQLKSIVEHPEGSTRNFEGFSRLGDLYRASDKAFQGRVTVPVLFDLKTKRIVNNESAEIIRMMNHEKSFGSLATNKHDFFRPDLRDEIKRVNAPIYSAVNNGVYRCGFADSQNAYDESIQALFSELESLDSRLANRTYLVGDKISEADVRLWTTLIRFDCVYVEHFKCNLRRLRDYPNLIRFTKRLYAQLHETVNFDHIIKHYHMSHPNVNPKRIVSAGFAYARDHDYWMDQNE